MLYRQSIRLTSRSSPEELKRLTIYAICPITCKPNIGMSRKITYTRLKYPTIVIPTNYCDLYCESRA